MVGPAWPGPWHIPHLLRVSGWPADPDAEDFRCRGLTKRGARCRNPIFPRGQSWAWSDDGTAVVSERELAAFVAGVCWLHGETA